MREFLLKSVGALLVAFGFILTGQGVALAKDSKNMLANPGFETGNFRP